MPEPKRPLKVFLCHASADKPKVRELYRYLRRRGIKPWFDEIDLIGGQDWQVEIPKAIATSDAIIICLTKNSIDKEGYVQKEIKFALDKALEMPEGRIYLIPVRFEECEVPFSLSRYQWVDLFDEIGFTRLMRSLKTRAGQLERANVQIPKPDDSSPDLTSVSEEKAALENAENEVAEKAERGRIEREAAERAAREKADHEVAEKAARETAAREKAEKDAAESARLESEELEKQKTVNEKAELEAAKKAKQERLAKEARENQVREAAARDELEKDKKEKVEKSRREKKEDKPDVLKPRANNQVAYWLGGFAVLLVGIVFLSSLNNPSQFPEPTPTNTESSIISTSTYTKTVEPSATSTPEFTSTPANTLTPTPLPTEITDAKGVSMVLVKAGEFLMGSDNGDENEKPVHEVFLDAYYIDIYEVTNAAYKICVVDGACELPNNINFYDNSKYTDYPVVNVNWNMAKTYCEWRGARLPSEAEWEKAARGTDARTYPWGEDFSCDKSNSLCIGDLTKVGSYESGKSPYGVYDMAGNVWEWVSSLYQPYPYDEKDGRENFNSSGNRVLRGGSWRNGPGYVRSTIRNEGLLFTHDYIGFRCSISP